MCVCVCVSPCPQACALSSCHPDMLDGQAKHFCHSASPSPARPSPSANLLSSLLSPPSFLRHTDTCTHTFSILLFVFFQLAQIPSFLLACTRFAHTPCTINYTLTLVSWWNRGGFTLYRNSRSAGVLIHMLEPIKGVTFPLLWWTPNNLQLISWLCDSFFLFRTTGRE